MPTRQLGLTNMVDANGTTKYTYTAGNQVWTEIQGPTAATVTNTYANRLRTILTLQQAPGRPLWTNAFDSVARLTGTLLKNSGNTVLDSAIYGYNQASQRTAFTNAAGTYVQYSYDPLGQLKIADSSVNTEDRGYFYDAAWNLNRLTNNGTPSTLSVDGKNQLTADPNSGTDTYDANGNLTQRTVAGVSLVYGYDDENRLTNIIYGLSWNSQFYYDGLSRLRGRTDHIWTGTNWYPMGGCSYLYDGNLVIQERNGAPTVTYTRGPDLSGTMQGAGGIGGLLARSSGYSLGNWSTHHFYHADVNGNITYLVDSSQAMAATYRYDPFGNTISSSGTMAATNVYRFSSKEIHVNSGLYNYLYRWYDPNLQRWPNRDPISEAGGINLYEYVGNSPTRFVDPLGLDYYVITVTAFSGFPHQVVIGDNGSGGSYVIDYGPASGGLNRIYGPGKYNYTPYSFSPKQSAFDLSNARCTKTSPSADKALSDLAAGLGANNNTPNYFCLGNNCWSTAPIFDTTASNYQNFGTSYPPINTRENLPPLRITR